MAKEPLAVWMAKSPSFNVLPMLAAVTPSLGHSLLR
jgi:hypothetical protein